MIDSFDKDITPRRRLDEQERDTMSVVSDFEDEQGQHAVIEVEKKPPGLFLFDIDGTLIDAKKVHGPAAIDLYKETFGGKFNLPFDDTEFAEHFVETYISHFGAGDRQEFEMLCDDFNITFGSEDEKKRFLDEMTPKYGPKIEALVLASTPEARKAMVLPGVVPFLDEMKARKIPAALVTGNSERSAHTFMKYLGLAQYFITGGFDDDRTVTDEPYRRANILRSALVKCRMKGIQLPDNAAIFGDTPKDFKATLYDMQGMKPHVFLVASGHDGLYDLADVQSEETGKRPHLVMSSFAGVKLKIFFDDVERYGGNNAKLA